MILIRVCHGEFIKLFTSQAVVSSAVNVICELARKNAKNYLVLAPVLFKLLTKSANNWMLIKIVKLVSESFRSTNLFLSFLS